MAVGGVRVIRDGRIQEVQADCDAAVELSEEGEHAEMGWRREGVMAFERGGRRRQGGAWRRPPHTEPTFSSVLPPQTSFLGGPGTTVLLPDFGCPWKLDLKPSRRLHENGCWRLCPVLLWNAIKRFKTTTPCVCPNPPQRNLKTEIQFKSEMFSQFFGPYVPDWDHVYTCHTGTINNR